MKFDWKSSENHLQETLEMRCLKVHEKGLKKFPKGDNIRYYKVLRLLDCYNNV